MTRERRRAGGSELGRAKPTRQRGREREKGGWLFNIPMTCTCSCLCHITWLIKHGPITSALINGRLVRERPLRFLMCPSSPNPDSLPSFFFFSLPPRNQIICLARPPPLSRYGFNGFSPWLSINSHCRGCQENMLTIGNNPFQVFFSLFFLLSESYKRGHQSPLLSLLSKVRSK